MKKYYLIISLLIFSFCSSQDMATDSQRNWCYYHAEYLTVSRTRIEFLDVNIQQSWKSFDVANELAFKKDIIIDSTRNNFQTLIGDNEENSLKICKIWADMNDAD